MPFLFLIVMVVFGVVGRNMALSRGRDGTLWFFICFFTCMLGVIILAVIGPERQFRSTPEAIVGSSSVRLEPLQVRAAMPASPPPAPRSEPEFEKWRALKEYDEEIAAAAAQIIAVSPSLESKLARDFLALNDKRYLPVIIEKLRVQYVDELRLNKLGSAVEADRLAARQGALSSLDLARQRSESIIANGFIDAETGRSVKTVRVHNSGGNGTSGLILRFGDEEWVYWGSDRRATGVTDEEAMRAYFANAK